MGMLPAAPEPQNDANWRRPRATPCICSAPALLLNRHLCIPPNRNVNKSIHRKPLLEPVEL
eukprot:559099-Lingulodinium_polyedra.AAC.1